MEGSRLLITGATGFVGKVVLSLLLDSQPRVGRVLLLARPGKGRGPAQRIDDLLASSPAFAPLRERHGEGLLEFARERIEVLPGDVVLPDFGWDQSALGRLAGRVDALVHCAGLISFNPSLADAVRVNVRGARHAARLAARLGARLVHVSTCYVAGSRRGEIYEDEPLLGRFPASERVPGPFDAERELAECERIAAAVESEAQGRDFLVQARKRQNGRPSSERIVKTVAERLASRWLEEKLAAEGLKRARHWGWPNIYCYTKALGEQLIAATPGLDYAIVRPSIVESALRYPFPGWNEGMNTSAPVILAMCKGLTAWPAHPRAPLDYVPVDLVASGVLAVTGAALLGRHDRVYHLASSDLNPFPVRRCMDWVGQYSRRHFRDHASGPLWLRWLLSRQGVIAVSEKDYRRFGAPALRRVVGALSRAPAGRRISRSLERLERELARVEHVVEAFLPFLHDTDCVFRTDHMRALHERMSPADRKRLPWDPHLIDWRRYWFDVHLKGLRKWVFPRPCAPTGSPVNRLIRRGLSRLLRAAYALLFKTEVRGAPPPRGCLVASNHASHLDMGLVKYALGERGEGLVTLAAKDYFFQSPLLGGFFRRYTNLLPIARNAAVKDSLQAASRVLREGGNLLIFPEATRTSDGRMAPFKSTVGYLALQNKSDVLPVYLKGTFEALPKGGVLPRRRRLEARLGPLLPYEELRRRTQDLPAKDACRAAAAIVEAAVKSLA